jgi:hypothetical protein
MTEEINVLGQQPVHVSLAGQELSIYPPTSYRLNQLVLCADKARARSEAKRKAEEVEDADAKERGEEVPIRPFESAPVDYGILRLICKTKDVFVNGQLVEGEIPAAVKSDEFWSQEVQIVEIAGLFGVFIDLIDIDKLRKNVLMLMGR